MRYFVIFILVALFMWHMVAHDHLDVYFRGQSMPWYPAPTRGVLAPDDPLQTPPDRTSAWTFHGYTITPLADYRVKARLLHRASYAAETNGEISPLDFALGWGPMSDPVIYGQLNIGQAGRWYSWSYPDSPPIPDNAIICHSANTHLIPATDHVLDQLLDFCAGDVIQLDGYLVEVDTASMRWRSSLSRTDTGDGSCELMWVESAVKVGR